MGINNKTLINLMRKSFKLSTLFQTSLRVHSLTCLFCLDLWTFHGIKSFHGSVALGSWDFCVFCGGQVEVIFDDCYSQQALLVEFALLLDAIFFPTKCGSFNCSKVRSPRNLKLYIREGLVKRF